MAAFLVRRLWQSAILLLLVTVLAFVLVLIAGDPVRVLLPIDASPSDVENLRHQFGLDQPIWVQYLLFLQNAASGDLGQSFKFREPAMPLVLERLPITAILTVAALAWSTTLALPLGILAATRRGSIWDHLATVATVAAVSIPGFWLGIVLILYFAGQLRWLPASGAAGPSSLILPALTLGAQPFGVLTRVVRATMLEELRHGYLVTARSKGLAEWIVLWRHALRNALIPIVTVLGLQLGGLLGGAVIIETVFAWPGDGWLLIQAISAHDMPLLRANVLVIAIVFIAINAGTDLLYAYLNPRIRYA